jgi:hypothetical protein
MHVDDSRNGAWPDFHDYGLNGSAALRSLLSGSVYGSVPQAVAALTAFTHPSTVAATGNRPVFPVIRASFAAERGRFMEMPGWGQVMVDDNRAPACAFLWANGFATGSVKRLFGDVQFNHVWSDSRNVQAYTCLANLCVTPSFLAKLTDTDEIIRALIRRRAYDLYGFAPEGEPPSAPAGYGDIHWCDPLPAVAEVEEAFRRAMGSKAKDRVTRCAREIGWVYSDYRPDPLL